MNVKPVGDYYVWYCSWCDSRNLTLWTKIDSGKCCCTACQRAFGIESNGELHDIECCDLLLKAV